MTETNKLIVAEKVLALLERQKFAKWYGTGGRFDNYITSYDAPTKDEILQDIIEMLHLPDEPWHLPDEQ